MDKQIIVQRVANGFVVTPNTPSGQCYTKAQDIFVAETTDGLLAVIKSWAIRSDQPLAEDHLAGDKAGKAPP